ncbi:XRE family transcriptional regulator [Streptomyces uncialis]|uniref:XRE family transcriptional regulator n=1 Tax=Streptomyces uncialis TaxID=1048205 RepID=UPI0037B8C0F2
MRQHELAESLNKRIEGFTGRYGTLQDRHIRNWLTGKTRWPQARQRRALEEEFGCELAELGFQKPPPRSAVLVRQAFVEGSVKRRRFTTAAAAITAGAALPDMSSAPTSGGPTAPAPPVLASSQVGISDVQRLRQDLDHLTLMDDRRGGHKSLEDAAIAGAQRALGLQERSATQRIRKRLHGIGAEYTTRAAWACFDSRDFDRAHSHLARATVLAGMSQDHYAQLSVWNVMSMVSFRQSRHADAIAAAEAAQALVARRDPLLASLAHARSAVAHAGAGDRQSALRQLGRAGESLTKTASTLDAPRPSWLDFYGSAELWALSAVVHFELGAPEEAEASAHQALAALPPRFRRNRGLITTRMATAQLQQDDVELSYTTAASVFDIMDGTPLPARMRTALGDYRRELVRRAPTSVQARDWTELMNAKGS